MSSTLSTIVWVMAFIAVTGIIGFDVGPITASAGPAGVALAFGAQSLFTDLLGGAFILLETVLDGTVWHVRNGSFDRVGNHSQVWSAALIDVGVVHGTTSRWPAPRCARQPLP